MYMLIQKHNNPLSINRACSCLGVSRSGYSGWMRRQQSCAKDPFEMKLKDEMQKIAVEFSRYEYRRMTKELQRRGFQVNHKRVLRLMKEDNLLCAKRLFHPQTTDSNHSLRVYPNLAKDLNVTGLNQLWTADITYIRLIGEFVYLAVIIDVFSRRCVGWDLAETLTQH